MSFTSVVKEYRLQKSININLLNLEHKARFNINGLYHAYIPKEEYSQYEVVKYPENPIMTRDESEMIKKWVEDHYTQLPCIGGSNVYVVSITDKNVEPAFMEMVHELIQRIVERENLHNYVEINTFMNYLPHNSQVYWHIDMNLPYRMVQVRYNIIICRDENTLDAMPILNGKIYDVPACSYWKNYAGETYHGSTINESQNPRIGLSIGFLVPELEAIGISDPKLLREHMEEATLVYRAKNDVLIEKLRSLQDPPLFYLPEEMIAMPSGIVVTKSMPVQPTTVKQMMVYLENSNKGYSSKHGRNIQNLGMQEAGSEFARTIIGEVLSIEGIRGNVDSIVIAEFSDGNVPQYINLFQETGRKCRDFCVVMSMPEKSGELILDNTKLRPSTAAPCYMECDQATSHTLKVNYIEGAVPTTLLACRVICE